MPPTPRTDNVNLSLNLSEDMAEVNNSRNDQDALEESFEVEEADLAKSHNLDVNVDVGPDAIVAKDDSYEYATKRSTGSFVIEHCSNFFFLAASSLYVALAFQALHYSKKISDYRNSGEIPLEVLYANDDFSWYSWLNETEYNYDDYYIGRYTSWDDDYDMQFGTYKVSTYQILYFSAATCYVINGVLDLVLVLLDFSLLSLILGLLLVVAGAFGIASACLVETNARLAVIFNSVSVHLFLLEAVGLFCTRLSVASKSMKWFIRFGGLCWIIGTAMDAGFSYVYLFNMDPFWWEPPLWIVIGGICSAFLWLTSAIVANISTCCIHFKPELSNPNRAYHLDKEAKSFDEDEGAASPLSAKDSMAL